MRWIPGRIGQCAQGALITLAVAGCADGVSGLRRIPEPNAVLAKGGGGTTVTVTVADQAVGMAAEGDPFTVTIPSGGGLEVKPQCGTDDRLHLVGMDGVLGSLGVRSVCNAAGGKGFVFFKALVSTTTPAGACPGQTVPDGTNFAQTNRYFFQVDSDNDGRYDDAQYTIVLTNCTVSGGRVQASTGDLYEGGTLIGPGIAVSVDLTY